ncbi:MAG: phenylalanine--tRNA ligase subunit alpha, partial [Synechococcus sp. SB0662_bin_45]|nr:phenylalanine--tRNA ligase subunit alpha [Synechococcus sp. SB0662_bin_45]
MSTPVNLDTLTSQLDALEAQASDQIRRADAPQALEQLRIGLLGKKGGQLSRVLGTMGSLPHAQRPLLGQRANVLKKQIQELLNERLRQLEDAALASRLAKEAVDVSAPALYRPLGRAHPLLSTLDEIVTIFCGLGYQVVDGPEIETDHYNFSALNIPEDHPAREMQDTFYLPNGELLRTHTSPVQIRHLERHKPPVRVIAPGRVYRRDAVDATHSPIFH